jgi:preprotein translocase subunit SecG
VRSGQLVPGSHTIRRNTAFSLPFLASALPGFVPNGRPPCAVLGGAQFRSVGLSRRRAPPSGTSMQSVLLVIHILIVIALIAIVLLQRSEGGALGAGGGTGSFMTGRGQANALSRATAVLGALFFATALLMSILSSWSRAPHSILQRGPAPAGQTAPAPVSPGNILDQLKQLEGQSSTPSAPAPTAPSAPAPKP